ncbi:MAG: hypothetical protein JO154_20950 [Chitinophaga sp.]|uniref:immunity protein Imm33 domain-containing protein n=1 Tax=Chitinophaga sp. TaxID=1869181 RepID=UPI0025B9C7A4|nr:hypothetical protein [Chitinophaga sp.]MBV8255083.1 hypothetical protein [Chitinophaga sp.]
MDQQLLKLELEISHRQQELCRKYGAPYFETSIDKLLGIATETFAKPMKWPINGLRHPIESENSSNWYIWAGEDFKETDDFFQPMHIYHLNKVYPKILDYLGLPPGWRFLFDDTYEDVWYDESLLHI